MRTKILLEVLLVSLIMVSAKAGADETIWQDESADGALARADGERHYYRSLRADVALLRGFLDAAPREFAASHGTVLSLPMPDGSFQRFEVMESPVMAPELAMRYPDIRTYRAVGIDDPLATGRLDITPQGFHAMIDSVVAGTVFIDPDSQADRYRSFNRHDYGRALTRAVDNRPVCLVEGNHEHVEENNLATAAMLPRTGDQLRTYRLAVAATGEYTAYHGGSVPLALSAIVTAINRVNQIYGRDLAIGFVLVAANDSVIYTDAATDPYDNFNAVTIVAQNQTNLDAVLGSANYDIGHVFSTGSGGLAGLGVACTGGSKAWGTTGLAVPTGDPFYIDYVAHEIGHQLGANHSFNGTTLFCSGNRNAATAYEPGSGSTIMAYAGICGAENLQTNSDATFHAASIDEINAYVSAAGACYSGSVTGNTAPTVNAGNDFTIPSQTPFMLTAGAGTVDPDGHVISYQWDGMDAGTQTTSANTGTDLGDNALFRSFLPKEVPYRNFPKLGNQLTGTADIGETLPSTARTLNFRLTARDGNYGVDDDSVQLIVHNGSGPFRVTAPNGGETLTALFGMVNVTWDVAGTNIAPVSCANVDIELLTFSASRNSYCSTLLADDTPNDGSELNLSVTAANNSNARVRISCSDNVFYDVSDGNIMISGAATSAPTDCISTDGANREHGSVFVDAGTNVNTGGGGGGGGGGALAPWLLALLTVTLAFRYRLIAGRSV